MATTRALEGIRILELGQFLSAPRCAQILAEQGADVIKIEPPTGETMRMLMMVAQCERNLAPVNTGKRGITVNLKNAAGRELLLRLVEKADVVVENFTPGTMERMDLGYPRLAEANPRLIYASISGFGRTGELAERGAFDIIAQATSGVMDVLGLPDHPPGVPVADLVSGSYAAMAVGFALVARERTGRGQLIDISMQDVMYGLNFHAQSVRALGEASAEVEQLLGRRADKLLTDHENPLPFWNSYRAKDGHVAIVAIIDGQWRRLMEAIGRPELNQDDKWSNFVTRVHNAPEGVEIISAWTAQHTTAEIVETLGQARVPCGAVVDEAVNDDPHLAERGMLTSVEHARMGTIGVPGVAIQMSDTPGRIAGPHPDLGEHTEAVLAEYLSASAEEIATLRATGAI